MTNLDEKLRDEADKRMAKAIHAYNALNDLLGMAMEAEAYKIGYAYASVAVVWAREEINRLALEIARLEN
jgi:hypothetical protein